MNRKKRIFIDGSAGTTGLRIHQRLSTREDIELLTLSEADRKNPSARKQALNDCDGAFLCLPDEAARQAIALIENPNTVVFDTSTAHRTDRRFAYGFPELSPEHAEAIRTGLRIAVPGCHASGFIALVFPLLKAGILAKQARLVCHSITGYSGGGKGMIADYESSARSPLLQAPRQYALNQTHKHLPEIQAQTGLSVPPVFCPIVGDFYSGMEVTIPLFAEDLAPNTTPDTIKACLNTAYKTPLVRLVDEPEEQGFLAANALAGSDRMELSVHGNHQRILLVARYDNLGKGACGAAIECMNLAFGFAPDKGLEEEPT